MAEPALKPPLSLYDEDFVLWTEAQAELLRGRRFGALDLENLIDEVESLGRSKRTEIRNRLAVLLHHLVKWELQPERRKYGWRVTIGNQRDAILGILEDSPSLKRFPSETLDVAYRQGMRKASLETGLRVEDLPSECPYTLDRILDHGFMPGGGLPEDDRDA